MTQRATFATPLLGPIERGIPVPVPGRARDEVQRALIEQLSALEVGESFTFDGNADRVYRAARYVGAARELPMSVSLRRERKGCWRVWRID
jgi:hypothetical protein